MVLIHTVAEMQRFAASVRRAGGRLALVPTMGALHRGHLRLVEEAARHAEAVVVSIFVNPTQFGPNEDFDRYPRTLSQDTGALKGVEAVFAPSVGEMYRGGLPNQTWVDVEGLDEGLCGRHRSGHFRGVTTVVARLLNACTPDVAVFGLKDAQQFVILRRMAADMLYPVRMIGVETVREADGLALSSRNRYLTAEQRRQAVVLSRAVGAARRVVGEGEQRPDAVVETMLGELAKAPDARVQYAELVDAETLKPVETIRSEVLAAVAVYFGDTRLIDNAFITPNGSTT